MSEKNERQTSSGSSDTEILYRLGYADEINRLMHGFAFRFTCLKVASLLSRLICLYGEGYLLGAQL